MSLWQGLLERVRERGASTPRAGERRVHEQLARLFAPSEDGRAAEDAAEPMEVIGNLHSMGV